MELVNKFAFICRGLPGSGKSTIAHGIASQNGELKSFIEDDIIFYVKNEMFYSAVHSTDQFFMKDGVYNFNQERLGFFHSLNFKKFKQSLDLGIEIVICDNTNTTRKEYLKYVEAAKYYGYMTALITTPHPTIEESLNRNVHNVPREVIERMLSRWQA